MRRAAGLLLLVLAAGACSEDKPSPALTAPPPAAGYTRVIGQGFTIDMPAGWQQPALDPEAFAKTAAALRAKNPLLADALEAVRARIGSGSRLFAIDPNDGSSVNLVVVPSGGRSLDSIATQASKDLERVGVTGLTQQRTNVGQRQAVELDFTLPVKGESGTLAVPEKQFYVLRSGRLYILTLFGGSPNLAPVADSLRIS
ncbi:MAG: hypothetical protein ACRD12_03925 [Acidimicrobiales bacterium]